MPNPRSVGRCQHPGRRHPVEYVSLVPIQYTGLTHTLQPATPRQPVLLSSLAKLSHCSELRAPAATLAKVSGLLNSRTSLLDSTARLLMKYMLVFDPLPYLEASSPLTLSGRVTQDQLFWIAQKGKIATCRPTLAQCQAIAVNGSVYAADCNSNLPALCTQSAPASNISFADTAPQFQVQQTVGNQSLIGYRDFLTFRFLGIRFAPEPERFTYSTLYDGTGTNEALMPAPQCKQNSPNPNPLATFNNMSDSTDCLFLK